jgi:hypothetical protein
MGGGGGDGDLAFAHICHNTFYFIFSLKKNGEWLTSKTKGRCKKNIMASILYFSIIFSN